MRLDKFLCENGVGSRSQVKQLIRKGRVSINGSIATAPEQKLDEDEAQVIVDGKRIHYERYMYVMLNKPDGVVSATEDPKEKTVLSLLPDLSRDDLFPVGRLDKDTEGLLLITNNGQLAHSLLSPRKHVDKVYRVTALKPLDPSDLSKLEKGVDIGDEKPTEAAKAERISENEIFLTIHEGRYHQVKRMLTAIGNQVTALKRVQFGPLTLDEALKPGESRRLTAEEVKGLNDLQRNIDENGKK